MISSVRYSLVILTLWCVGCMPGEEPVEPFDRGDVEVQYIDVGPDKRDIVFYSLEQAKVVHVARPTDWDIYSDGNAIRLNYHRAVKYAVLNDQNTEVYDTMGLVFTSGQTDTPQYELQIGNKYVLDLGLDDNGGHLGFVKLSISLGINGLLAEYAQISSDDYSTIDAPAGTYFSFIYQSTADLPSDEEYDISFGKYMHYFAAEDIDYEVFGALTPGRSTIETSADFSSISMDALDSLIWVDGRFDVMGYDWKYYSLDKSAYAIDESKNFIIRSSNGFIYKLRFVNYYDNTGSSGYPTFEYKLL